MNDPRLPAFLQSLIVCILIVIALASFNSGTSEPPPLTADPELEARIERLERSVSELRSILLAKTTAESLTDRTDNRETVVTPDSSLTLRHEVDELRRLIQSTQRGVAAAANFRFESVRRSAPINKLAVKSIITKLNSDDETVIERTRHSLLYATQDEILNRFGRPTRIYANEGPQSRQMQYELDDCCLNFQFLNGHVVEVNE